MKSMQILGEKNKTHPASISANHKLQQLGSTSNCSKKTGQSAIYHSQVRCDGRAICFLRTLVTLVQRTSKRQTDTETLPLMSSQDASASPHQPEGQVSTFGGLLIMMFTRTPSWSKHWMNTCQFLLILIPAVCLIFQTETQCTFFFLWKIVGKNLQNNVLALLPKLLSILELAPEWVLCELLQSCLKTLRETLLTQSAALWNERTIINQSRIN